MSVSKKVLNTEDRVNKRKKQSDSGQEARVEVVARKKSDSRSVIAVISCVPLSGL